MSERVGDTQIQNFSFGMEPSRYVVCETEPAEADRLKNYHDFAPLVAMAGEPVEPLVISLNGLGLLSVGHKGLDKHMGHLEQNETGHSVSGKLITPAGEVYQASGYFLRRSLVAKALGRSVKGYLTLWKATPGPE